MAPKNAKIKQEIDGIHDLLLEVGDVTTKHQERVRHLAALVNDVDRNEQGMTEVRQHVVEFVDDMDDARLARLIRRTLERIAVRLTTPSEAVTAFINDVSNQENSRKGMKKMLGAIVRTLNSIGADNAAPGASISRDEDHASDLTRQSGSNQQAGDSTSQRQRSDQDNEPNRNNNEQHLNESIHGTPRGEDYYVYAGGYTVLGGPWYLVNAHENNGCEHLLLSSFINRKRPRMTEPEDDDHPPAKKPNIVLQKSHLEKENAEQPPQVGDSDIRLGNGPNANGAGQANRQTLGNTNGQEAGEQVQVGGGGANAPAAAVPPAITVDDTGGGRAQSSDTTPLTRPQLLQDRPLPQTDSTPSLPPPSTNTLGANQNSTEHAGNGSPPSRPTSGRNGYGKWRNANENDPAKKVGVDADPRRNPGAVLHPTRRLTRAQSLALDAESNPQPSAAPAVQAPTTGATTATPKDQKTSEQAPPKPKPRFPGFSKDHTTPAETSDEVTANTRAQGTPVSHLMQPQRVKPGPAYRNGAARPVHGATREPGVGGSSSGYDLLDDSDDEAAGNVTRMGDGELGESNEEEQWDDEEDGEVSPSDEDGENVADQVLAKQYADQDKKDKAMKVEPERQRNAQGGPFRAYRHFYPNDTFPPRGYKPLSSKRSARINSPRTAIKQKNRKRTSQSLYQQAKAYDQLSDSDDAASENPESSGPSHVSADTMVQLGLNLPAPDNVPIGASDGIKKHVAQKAKYAAVEAKVAREATKEREEAYEADEDEGSDEDGDDDGKKSKGKGKKKRAVKEAKTKGKQEAAGREIPKTGGMWIFGLPPSQFTTTS